MVKQLSVEVKPKRAIKMKQIDPTFDIWSEKGKTRQYKKVKITLVEKEINGVWHYSWFCRPNGEPHGHVIVTEAQITDKAMELSFQTAKNTIDKVLADGVEQLKRQGGKKI